MNRNQEEKTFTVTHRTVVILVSADLLTHSLIPWSPWSVWIWPLSHGYI